MKVLFVGFGSIAKKHAAVLRVIVGANLELFALRSSKEYKEIEGVVSVFNKEDVPKDLSFVIISNPTAFHYKSILEALELNIPIFIEKPVHHELNKLNELIDLFKKKKVKSYVACNLRFNKCLQFVKNKIDGGEYGDVQEVVAYCGSYLPDWRPNVDFKKVYSANEKLGGGVHLDLIHEIDYIFWLFGKPLDVKSFFYNKSKLDIDSVDYANYLLIYRSYVANISLNYFRKDSKRTLEVIFEKGTVRIDFLKNEVYENNELLFKLNDNDSLSTYKDQMEYFISNLENGTIMMNNIEEAGEVLKICLKNG
ncbi:MAG: gfo/Idh/MocA family oxidoreductase [Bacteroidetes bacterium]|nr:MAG: gfo/Idh/MocA family oxidoreductase [Bacteroidota bacterium]